MPVTSVINHRKGYSVLQAFAATLPQETAKNFGMQIPREFEVLPVQEGSRKGAKALRNKEILVLPFASLRLCVRMLICI